MTKRVRVFANTGWQSTGIHVTNNQKVHIHQLNLGQKWCTNPDKGTTDASGWPNTEGGNGWLVQGSQEGRLVALIGGTHEDIGTNVTFWARAGGELFLGANDDNFSDNWGDIEVEVDV